MGKIDHPVSIDAAHHTHDFVSGELALDNWLKRRALKNQANDASRTFVALDDTSKVVGYYCLSAGSATINTAPNQLRRNMPDPIPVMVLGRLAVDKHWQHQGVGCGLLKDAVLRTVKLSQDAGIKALLVHALSDTAAHFYKRFGFTSSPLDPMTLMLSMKQARRLLQP